MILRPATTVRARHAGNVQHGAGHARPGRQQVRPGCVLAGPSQPAGENGNERGAHLGLLAHAGPEGVPADRIKAAFTERLGGHHTRQAIDHGNLAHDGAGTVQRDDALLTAGGHNAALYQTMADEKAGIAGIAAPEEHVALAQNDRLGRAQKMGGHGGGNSCSRL